MLRFGFASADLILWGSQVSRYQIGDVPVVFPRQFLHTESGSHLSGGIPIAHPWFGARDGVLPRHGFLRDTSMMHGKQHNEASAQLLLDVKDTDFIWYPYPHAVSVTTTLMGDAGLQQHLWIRNTGTERMPVNPGWHPYLCMPQGVATVTMGEAVLPIGGTGYQWGKAEVLMPTTEEDVLVRLPGLGTVAVEIPTGFSRVVVWTDSKAYLCVEPVFTDTAFFATDEGAWLLPGNDLSCEFALRVMLG